MDRKILYIGNKLSHTEGGADVVNLRNIKLLFKIFGEKNVHFFELKNNSVPGYIKFFQKEHGSQPVGQQPRDNHFPQENPPDKDGCQLRFCELISC